MNTETLDLYFRFEQDFVEDNVRCIPMIVRFKLDACGIKLKLKEWSKMTVDERDNLAMLPCEMPEQVAQYNRYLKALILKHTGDEATELPLIENPSWSVHHQIPLLLQEKMNEFCYTISLHQWQQLSDLQRFALVKLSADGHENRNFPIAMKEFNLA